MAYLKPNAFVQRLFNPLAMRFGMSGTVRLTVRGRRSGQMQNIPVIPVTVDGARYIVSTRGESEWVRNVRAAGSVVLEQRGGSEQLQATEVPLSERPRVIEAYRQKAGRTVEAYWRKLPDPADHPVFRLAPSA